MIKIVGSFREPERATTALSVSAAAASAGVALSLWLAGDAVWLAVTPEHRGAAVDPEAEELLAAVLPHAGAAVCARCAERRGITADHLTAGARIAGAAAFVAAVTEPGAQALVY